MRVLFFLVLGLSIFQFESNSFARERGLPLVAVYGGVGSTHQVLSSGNGQNLPEVNSLDSGGGGFGVIFDLAKDFVIEPGLIYMGRRFKVGSATDFVELSYNVFQFPVLARYTGLSMFSFGMGPYFSTGIKGVNFKQGGQPVPKTFSSQGFKRTDLGWIICADAMTDIAPTLKMGLEFRYLHGLSDRDISDTTETKFRETEWFLKLRFEI